MSFFQRSFLIRSSALIALTLGCASPAMIGCGGGDDEITPPEDTGGDGDFDSTLPDSAKPDVGTDTIDAPKTDTADAADTAKGDTPDTADTLKSDTADAADTRDTAVATDTADTAVATDTADTAVPTDTLLPDTLCTPGTACGTGKICSAGGICGDCTTDAECSAATAGTLCFAGTCLAATCHPKTDTACTGTGVNCCANATSAGACVAPVSGATTCCDSTDCAGLTGTTTCDTTTNTCVCPAPTAGALFVAATGSDATGNGSASCPFATITKAITTLGAAPPVTPSTITVGAGTYGAGCTNAGGCDATPIAIPATITSGIVIAGSGTADAVKVVGAATAATNWVFNSSAPGTGFANMTIQATNTTATPGGGIRISAGAATAEASIQNVKIVGVGGVTPTNDGIRILGGASPQIGPGVTITGGAIGVSVTDSTTAGSTGSHPKIVSAAGAPVSISGTGSNCVRVRTTSAQLPYISLDSSDAATPVHLFNCNAVAGGSAVSIDETGSAPNSIGNTLIDRTSGPAFIGVLVANTSTVIMAADVIKGVGAPGVQVQGVSNLNILSAVTSDGNTRGVFITGNGTATINGLTAINSTGVGLEDAGLTCNSTSALAGATVKVRNSSFLGGASKGAYFTGSCTADLGTTGDPGNNVYNKTTAKNSGTGLCYLTTTTVAGFDATPTTSTWSCTSPVGTSTTPTAASPAFCLNGYDFGNRSAGITGRASLVSGQTCL
jgi:hypothetical protein